VNALKRALRALILPVESALETVFGPRLNPFTQLGTLGWFLFWIVTVSGIYVYMFFDTGLTQAWESLETLSREQLLRPYPHYTSIAAQETTGKRWYNSVQIGAVRHDVGLPVAGRAPAAGAGPHPQGAVADLDRDGRGRRAAGRRVAHHHREHVDAGGAAAGDGGACGAGGSDRSRTRQARPAGRQRPPGPTGFPGSNRTCPALQVPAVRRAHWLVPWVQARQRLGLPAEARQPVRPMLAV
jgi:hypothetical protein